MSEALRSVKSDDWSYCPACGGGIDTGYECGRCGRDWIEWHQSRAALRQEVERLTAERDEARSMRDFAKEDRDLYYQRWEAVSKERDEVRRQWHIEQFCNTNGQRQLDDLKAALARVEGELLAERQQRESDNACFTTQAYRLAQAAQREARLRAALEDCARMTCPVTEDPRESCGACEICQAQQLLSQLPTALTDQSDAVHKKEP